MAHPLLPPAQVERFRTDLERLASPVPVRIGVAVSGGADSLALMLLAGAAFLGRIHVATVDHCLRPESAEEAQFVADLTRQLQIPHSILQVEVNSGGQGLQGEARRARYEAMRGWAAEQGIPILCTAHHADDQAETILMRLQRGSGAGGLAGVRALRREGKTLLVARPLLGWPRQELADLVLACGISPVDDPSNHDERFDRVVMRRFLAANPQFDPKRLGRSAASLAEADAALEWMADLLEAERCTPAEAEWRIDTGGLPRELVRRLLSRTIAKVRREHGVQPPWTGKEDVENLLQQLEKGGTATLAGTVATAKGAIWSVRPAPPRRPR